MVAHKKHCVDLVLEALGNSRGPDVMTPPYSVCSIFLRNVTNQGCCSARCQQHEEHGVEQFLAQAKRKREIVHKSMQGFLETAMWFRCRLLSMEPPEGLFCVTGHTFSSGKSVYGSCGPTSSRRKSRWVVVRTIYFLNKSSDMCRQSVQFLKRPFIWVVSQGNF